MYMSQNKIIIIIKKQKKTQNRLRPPLLRGGVFKRRTERGGLKLIQGLDHSKDGASKQPIIVLVYRKLEEEEEEKKKLHQLSQSLYLQAWKYTVGGDRWCGKKRG